MNKEKTKDYMYILILILVYILIITIKSNFGEFILGSIVDFEDQHYLFPEYIRELFYENHDFFPDFAFNIGAGENIYNLVYHGFLNPILTLSFLFPKVSLLNYLVILMSIIVVTSTILFYVLLKKNNHNSLICFLCSLMLLCSSPLIFHSNRHIMFIDYFPFLLMGFFGMDLFIKKNKSYLFIISILLIIFTSFYFSISAIISIYLYGLYKYIKQDNKNIGKFTFRFGLRLIIPIAIAGILIFPVLYIIIDGRDINNVAPKIYELFMPKMYMLYDNYAIGLTMISFIMTIYVIFTKKKENIMLSLFIIMVSMIPIFCYTLNGFLYVRRKVIDTFYAISINKCCRWVKVVF